jgi:hypothetical protein
MKVTGLQGVLLGAQYARFSMLTSAAPRVRRDKLRVQQRHECSRHRRETPTPDPGSLAVRLTYT